MRRDVKGVSAPGGIVVILFFPSQSSSSAVKENSDVISCISCVSISSMEH